MKVNFAAIDPAGHETEALFVFLFTEDKPGLRRRPDLKGLKNLINPRLKAGDFKGDYLRVLPIFRQVSQGPERIVLIGLGGKDDFSPLKLRKAAAKAARTASDYNLEAVSLLLPAMLPGLDKTTDKIGLACLGFHLGQYKYNELKTGSKKKETAIKQLALIAPDDATSKREARLAVRRAEIFARAICLARDLTNRPANLLKPEDMAREARKMARAAGLKIKVLSMAEAKKRKMGAFLAVAQGSEALGCVIILEHQGAGPREKPLVLVGKAITFDSGGLSLKPPASMETMKTDMAGGAAVMAVMGAAAELNLKTNLIGIVPAAENMPSGISYRPGDSITTMSGQTVEIISTDAEGRMILADGLTLAETYKPRAIIDMATLTGAASIALGNKIAGLMSNDNDLKDQLEKAAEESGDLVWELPLFEDYFEQMESKTADFKNTGGRAAGTIIGGLFLKKFITDTPWAHLDIAGTARSEKDVPDTPAGATGFGVSLLIQYLMDNG
ncbi:MAG: leucyl aminopeptidase [Deltaproteobacteria bacterium]|nr:leucyl aminopeptidase [Deltaproteobacteria bacterium]